jgi:2-polyprenyl-3-methyl-5-hydroxy-6-metoxy-1,4-benzoquinol methylase
MDILPYQDKPDPWSSHSVILNWLAEFDPQTRILDVGTASGTLGRLSPKRFNDLYGLEPNPQWLELAKPFYKEIFCGTLENAPQDFLSNYQVVICGDVLEHLPDPQLALTWLVGLQPAGAVFIISVPNIANLWVRVNLLLGRFDYAERGILDRTHLRFFTRKSFLELLAASSLSVLKLKITPIPLNLVHPFWVNKFLGRHFFRWFAWLTSLLPTLLGYQFVVFAVKK